VIVYCLENAIGERGYDQRREGEMKHLREGNPLPFDKTKKSGKRVKEMKLILLYALLRGAEIF
jgi:hypothetical protein